MRGEGAAGCVGSGCGGLSLVGLLVGVGLTFWLGSMALDGPLGGGDPKPRDAAQLAEVIDSTTSTTSTASTTSSPATAGLLAVDADPATGLSEGDVVTVTSDAFPAGAQVWVETCISPEALADRLDRTCATDAAALAVVDERGHLVVRYPVARVVGGGIPTFDCAARAEMCSVVVTDAADEKRVGAARIAFREGLPRPEVTPPG